jgi:trimethylamine--corrinoid protein Co-methyltransferase
MARFYQLPSRSGGGLTDANFPDAQAGIQSTLALSTAIRSGINFILHACGILGAYVAMSFEKFIIDEELCRMLKRMIEPIDTGETAIDLAMIRDVGIGGNYLTQPKTFELCRTAFFLPELMTVQDYDGWHSGGAKRVDERATDILNKRLANYEKPEIDPTIESELSEFVARRKNG